MKNNYRVQDGCWNCTHGEYNCGYMSHRCCEGILEEDDAMIDELVETHGICDDWEANDD